MAEGDVDPRDIDVAVTVVVPSRPGPLVRLADVDRERDDLDEVLDDAFGAPDDGGPGPFDLVLLLGGAGAVIAGLTSLAPVWVLWAGVVAFVLGAILPLRSLWRLRAAARRTARLQAAIGDGALLRTDHPAVATLVAAHARCVGAATGTVDWRRVQVDVVAHAAVIEVVTLLAGRPPVVAGEVQYVEARAAALTALADALDDPAVRDGDGDDLARRQAVLEARAELDDVAGSSALGDVETLTRSLRGEA
jgi:hypothetical protein